MLDDYFFDQSVTEELGIYRWAKRESCPFSRAGRFIFYPVRYPLFALKVAQKVPNLVPQVSSPRSIGEYLVIDLKLTAVLDFASQRLMADQRGTLLNRL